MLLQILHNDRMAAQSELSNSGGSPPGDAKEARVKSAAPFGAKESLGSLLRQLA